MSTHAARFGARIGGIRRRMQPDKKLPLASWDLNAWIYDVVMTAPHGHSSTTFMVLAFDDEQAETFARMRYPAEDGTVSVQARTKGSESQEEAKAIVDIESSDESMERYMRWMQQP